MSKQLKPCPFCGTEPQEEWSGGRQLLCEACGVGTSVEDTPEQALKAWNTRAPDSALSAEVERITLLYREAIQLADANRRRAEAAEARVAELATERAQLFQALKWANERVGSLSAPAMNGDNLAVTLCSFFDDGEPPDDDSSWSPAAIDGYEQTIQAIRDHYATALAALSNTKEG